MSDLQERYDALFSLYVAHIHNHRMGVGRECEECIRAANQHIKDEIDRRRAEKSPRIPLESSMYGIEKKAE